MPKRGKVNIFIDAVLLLCMAALAGSGFINAFRLPPGYEKAATYDRFVDLTFHSGACARSE